MADNESINDKSCQPKLGQNSRFHERKARVCLLYDVWQAIFIFLIFFLFSFSPVKEFTKDGGAQKKEWIYLKRRGLFTSLVMQAA